MKYSSSHWLSSSYYRFEVDIGCANRVSQINWQTQRFSNSSIVRASDSEDVDVLLKFKCPAEFSEVFCAHSGIILLATTTTATIVEYLHWLVTWHSGRVSFVLLWLTNRRIQSIYLFIFLWSSFGQNQFCGQIQCLKQILRMMTFVEFRWIRWLFS